jgi:proline dehydrogenase
VALDRQKLLRVAMSDRLERAVRALAPVEELARRAASRYVAGGPAEAFARARTLSGRGVGASLDEFGVPVSDLADAQRVAADYMRLAGELSSRSDDVWLSVDLSHLGLDADPRACAEHLAQIAGRIPLGRRIQVGSEDHGRAEAIVGCVLSVARAGLADRLGATVPANFRRSPADLERLVDAGVHVRLVKGAFRAPVDLALPSGEPTCIAFLRLAHRLAEVQARFALATHDGMLREAALLSLGPRPVEQLLGVRPDMLDELAGRGVPVRVYVPFGREWFRYWMRHRIETLSAAAPEWVVS